MRIASIHVRRFRSLWSTGVLDCGGFNVLVGKNNAGKSNILGAIALAIDHLSKGSIAGHWPVMRRHADEFNSRDSSRPLQIGIEFTLDEATNAALRGELLKEVPQLEKAVEQIAGQSKLSLIVAGAIVQDTGFLFLESASIGPIVDQGGDLVTTGPSLIRVPLETAAELYQNIRDIDNHRADQQAIGNLQREKSYLEYTLRERNARPFLSNVRDSLHREIEAAARSSKDLDQLTSSIGELAASISQRIREVQQRSTSGAIGAFAGDVHSAPHYVEWVMSAFGKIPIIHFQETKAKIGPEEAASLLRLKVRRGGEQRLATLKATVKTLLGVNVDAFEPDEPAARPGARVSRRAAEMDVDDFLVEANGAGIREALRIILDLELREPQLVLIEEPEVHLHPGLERVLHQYLQEKSAEVQMFVTTHSTNFVDAASPQNVYVVSRAPTGRTAVESVMTEAGALAIPGELGLRLSTVFMFDRLVFVEGRSDEEVLRELARKFDRDIARANVGFVVMGGVRNFAHFAAQHTLDLLTRRQVKIWFVVDRDEADDNEVKAMVTRIGDAAKLNVLSRRELENYLLDPSGVAKLVDTKTKGGRRPDVDEIDRAINEEAQLLKDRVIELRLERTLLRPVFLQTRGVVGTIPERLREAVRQLETRAADLDQARNDISAAVQRDWQHRALEMVPGSDLLDHVLRRYGVGFSKESDSVRLARALRPHDVHRDLRELLEDVIP